MDERTSGLVLRVRPLTETSLIVQWLTRTSGASPPWRKRAAQNLPFAASSICFTWWNSASSGAGEANAQSAEVSVQEFHEPLRQSVKLLQQAAYLVQLLEQSTEKETPLPGFLELMTEALNTLA
jgi:recombinational DNA repair protein (RecF pathway)